MVSLTDMYPICLVEGLDECLHDKAFAVVRIDYFGTLVEVQNQLFLKAEDLQEQN